MNPLENPLADNLFLALSSSVNNVESIASTALKSGIDSFSSGKYERAIQEFKRSIALSPYSQNAPDAAAYMAEAYLKLDDKDSAIKAFKQAIDLDGSRDDFHISLGNLHYDREQFSDAVKAYEAAVRINPSNSTNRYSLGQGYISTGEYDKARVQFEAVVRLEPRSASGSFGMGQAYAKEGDYENAVEAFKKAIAVDDEFMDAYAELGFAYADMGDMENAQAQLDELEGENETLANLLSSYMYEKEAPKIEFARSASTFKFYRSMKTPVSALDGYLANANAEKTLTMQFVFSKDMDVASVQNRYNWNISRSSESGPGQKYNFGLPVADTEAQLMPFPEFISYDPDSRTATVGFRVKQNAAANATIDPSHIKFQFKGEDTYGNVVDPHHDEFTGFSGVK